MNILSSIYNDLYPINDEALFASYLKAGDKALDMGCASGRVLKQFLALGALPYGVDISESMLEVAKKVDSKFNLRKNDFTKVYP